MFSSNIQIFRTGVHTILGITGLRFTLVNQTLILQEGSEATISRSVSSTSFMSAISEQEDLEVIEHEDFGLVNLHIQVMLPFKENGT